MAEKFGTYADQDLPDVIRDGVREAWRVARLGIIVKVTDHVHGQRYVLESDWVREAIGQPPFDEVYQVRSGAMIDPKWEEQLSAYNNGSTYLIFRKSDQKHVRRQS
jgi:Arc/MetJ-type ribon-helix-helix transcriptional regulator